MNRRTLRHVLVAVCAIACSFSVAQFSGTYGTEVTTAPTTVSAIGWNLGTGSGNFQTGVPWQWYGTFTWTVSNGSGVTAPNAPVTSQTSGTTTIDFTNMATGHLPAGSFVYLGDIDEQPGEWIDLEARDSNGNVINPNAVTGRWITPAPQHWYYGNGGYARPIASLTTTGYRFTGYDAGNSLRTLVMLTSKPIRSLKVTKNHVNNGFGLGAPVEPPYQGIEELAKGCCEGKNFIENSTFKFGNVGFGSQFSFVAPNGALSAPSQYGIFNGASVISRLTPPMLPVVVDEVTNSMSSGNFLVARVSSAPSVIWKQSINVPQGELVACVRLKPLYVNPAWPPVNVSFRFQDNNSNHTHTKPWFPLPAPGAGGWHDFTATFHHWGNSPVTMEIVADSPAASAMMPIYLGLDNLSLKPKTMTPPLGLFAVTPSIANLNLGVGEYNVVLTSWPNPSPLGYYWSITDLSTNQEVQNPSHWWYAAPPSGFNFPGYLGTGTNNTLTGSQAGKFFTNRTYRITYGLWGTCQKWQSVSWEIGYFGPSKKEGPPEIRRVRSELDLAPPRRGFNPDAIDELLRPNRRSDVRALPPMGGRGGRQGGGGVPRNQ